MISRADDLADFSVAQRSWYGEAYPVYTLGSGPGVVVVHEVPGITPEVARFARRVAAEGFRVYLPSLFGEPGRPFSLPYVAEQISRACVRREFAVLAAKGSSPITHWLRALCRDAHAECGGPGVGALGMCLTGNFALALMVDESVMAPVLSQPSLPFPIDRERRAGLHLSEGDLACVRRRVKQDGVPVLGLRFTADRSCPSERFDTLRTELGAGFEAIEIDSGLFNPHGIVPWAHSVLTNDLIDEQGHPTHTALLRVLAFFRERLR